MSNGTDQIVWMQSAEPISLFCNDETDGETFAACLQTFESLLSFKPDGVEVEPGLAEVVGVDGAGAVVGEHRRRLRRTT